MASRYVAPPAPTAPAPEPVAADDGPSFEDVEVSIDEILVSRLPADAFDDVAPLAEQVVPDAVPETMPEAPVVEATEPETISAPIPEPIAQALPEPISEPVVEAIIETPEIAPEPEALAPQLSLFSEPVAPAAATAAPAAAVATLPSIDLARLHAMELDPLFHDAVDAVLERERASAVVLQRQLGIGYARGIRILDQMTTAGLVGPDTPTGAREIRVAREAWKSFVGA
jgi:DNA segregation ATPase FtsK/SpoIIIE-like protein